jgi:hypothetical protein
MSEDEEVSEELMPAEFVSTLCSSSHSAPDMPIRDAGLDKSIAFSKSC